MQIGAIFNYTPFVAAVSIVQDKDGGDYAVALLKATFTFNAHGVVQTVPHAERVPVFYTDPGGTLIRAQKVSVATVVTPMAGTPVK